MAFLFEDDTFLEAAADSFCTEAIALSRWLSVLTPPPLGWEVLRFCSLSKLLERVRFSSMMRLYSLARWRTADPLVLRDEVDFASLDTSLALLLFVFDVFIFREVEIGRTFGFGNNVSYQQREMGITAVECLLICKKLLQGYCSLWTGGTEVRI